MTDTLLTVVQRINAKVGLDETITAFSYNDESQLIVDYINDALLELWTCEVIKPFFNIKNGSISLVSNTRLYDVASDALALEVFDWSFRNDSDNNTAPQLATLEFIKENKPNYETDTGKPQYIYIEGSQLGIYPLPDAAYALDYIYPGTLTRLSLTTATFPYPDQWLPFIEAYAREQYEINKGLGNPTAAENRRKNAFNFIYVECWKKNPTYFG